jgi:hypothetical protein
VFQAFPAGDFRFRVSALGDDEALGIEDAYTYGNIPDPAVPWYGKSLSDELDRRLADVRFGEHRGLARIHHASWFMARLLRLLSGRDDAGEHALGDHMGGDGSAVRFEIALTALDGAGQPASSVTAHCDPKGVGVNGKRRPHANPEAIWSAFVEALVAEPTQLAKCVVNVSNVVRRRSKVYGWDGRDFLTSRKRGAKRER